MIRAITFSAFRGIVHPLRIDLVRNGKPSSLAIFGRNGFGKSSITDGWEWFHSGTIQHLAREGAMAAAYPSRGAGAKATPYVEVEFSDSTPGTVRLSLQGSRAPGQTNPEGYEWFKQRAKHPCHIRFEDLTRFVFLTKTARFDELANLMGFAPQVELLRQLRRVEGKLTERLNRLEREYNASRIAVATHFKLKSEDEVTNNQVLSRYAGLFARHKISTKGTWDGVDAAILKLAEAVEHDIIAHEIKELTALGKCIERIPTIDDQLDAWAKYVDSITAFKAKEGAVVDGILLSLYQRGKSALLKQREAIQAVSGTLDDLCPLCGQRYTGDLLEHIQSELTALQELRDAHEVAGAARKQAQLLLPEKDALATAFSRGLADSGSFEQQFTTADLMTACAEMDALIKMLRNILSAEIERLSDSDFAELASISESLQLSQQTLARSRQVLLDALRPRLATLAANDTRKALVEDHQKAVRGKEIWNTYVRAGHEVAALRHCYDEYQALVELYVRMNMADVEKRFAAISSNVDRYFSILEASTEGIAHPALRLVRDQDRAVVLEIEFRGEVISPAYSYLSESQLNSFGLAVFLASARLINCDFRLLILDDVVSSFDAYKRPALIRLLKQEFSDFQVVVLTHDDVWWTQLSDQCATWQRLKIRQYTAGIGPVIDTSQSDLQAIQEYLVKDEATSAARTLGPMLERKLQEICEAFGVKVAYNRRNEYTLRPLLQCFLSTITQRLVLSHEESDG